MSLSESGLIASDSEGDVFLKSNLLNKQISLKCKKPERIIFSCL